VIPTVITGLERLIAAPPAALKGRRLGLLCNQSSTDRRFRHARDLIQAALPGQLSCLFSPQHGFFSEKQDNMVESGHGRDTVSGLPVFSLYAESRRPTPEMFELFDVLLVDLVDVGTRVYTFFSTLAYCLEAAAASGREVLVLDRPNPVGGEIVEGNLLKPGWTSFVGLYPIPMRHGLTFGELALLLTRRFGLDAEVTVLPMQGWRRTMMFRNTGLPWVFPSPNMPTPETALVYPGQVLWEGTNVSEGRGTTMPFEIFGAPWIEPAAVLAELTAAELAGCILRPLGFEPTFHKWAGESCRGFQLHVTEAAAFRPLRTSLALLRALMRLYPGDFACKPPPYEYEYERLPLDLILGDAAVRESLAGGVTTEELERSWHEELCGFAAQRAEVSLYP